MAGAGLDAADGCSGWKGGLVTAPAPSPATPAGPAGRPARAGVRKRILSLGAGVQSTTLLLMSIRGELPRLDCCIFADTQYEPPAVYRHLEWLRGESERAGIPVHTVTAGDLRADAIAFRRQRYDLNPETGNKKGCASIPLFVLNADGSQGLIRRQCTAEYKIEPIERFIRREILGLAPRQHAPKEAVVEQWFGITWDERRRVRPSPSPWKIHVYPFCAIPDPIQATWVRSNGTPRLWTRRDCVRWLETNYPDRTVPRSACVCCPYRSNAEWRAMRDGDPASFADAVEFDREVRDAQRAGVENGSQLTGTPFVHRQMVPLDEAKIDDDGPGLWDGVADNECEGMCGV